jgi:hypothetical protein
MTFLAWVLALLISGNVYGAEKCKAGYVPSDTEGVCVEKPVEVTNPAWVSDEKPPTEKHLDDYRPDTVNAPNMRDDDEKADKEKADADAEGRKSAGIK